MAVENDSATATGEKGLLGAPGQKRRGSEHMSDVGSERCPFETNEDPEEERKLTDAPRTS